MKRSDITTLLPTAQKDHRSQSFDAEKQLQVAIGSVQNLHSIQSQGLIAQASEAQIQSPIDGELKAAARSSFEQSPLTLVSPTSRIQALQQASQQ